MSIFDVLEYGPIVHADEDLGILWTVNGAYLNLWVHRADGWDNIDCRSGHDELGKLTVGEAMDMAERWAREIHAG